MTEKVLVPKSAADQCTVPRLSTSGLSVTWGTPYFLKYLGSLLFAAEHNTDNFNENSISQGR